MPMNASPKAPDSSSCGIFRLIGLRHERFEHHPYAVERSVVCLDKSCRLWKDCRRLSRASLPFIRLAFLALLLERS